MIKKYITLLSVVMFSIIATNYARAIEIKEIYKLTPQDAETQSNFNADRITGTKGNFELEGAWLSPRDTIFASNGYILYWISIHDAKFYDKFIWDYFIPVLSPQTGIPTGEYDTLFMAWFTHMPPYLTYMPPDSSNPDTRYWEPYWRFWSVYGGGGDYFNPDSCWAFGVGFSFLDMDTYYRDPGVWKTEVNMATKT
ncbi:hypothetical protein HY768_04790, partial [candidate division TA06 bacterium]|nr:hypothetical protein [candidate division TA06 bacterium]